MPEVRCWQSVTAGGVMGLVVCGLACGASRPSEDCLQEHASSHDFDQVRAEACANDAGLPNDGGSFCVPTSVTHWLAWLNQNGFVWAMPGSDGEIRDWSAADQYSNVTEAIRAMGVLMETNPSGGTRSSVPVIEYLNGLYEDRFYTARQDCTVDDPTKIDARHMHGLFKVGAMPYLAIAWYRKAQVDGETRWSSSGSHVASLPKVDVCGESDQIFINDPGSGGSNRCTQSAYASHATGLTPRGDVPWMWPKDAGPFAGERLTIDRYHREAQGRTGVLQGVRSIYPSQTLWTDLGILYRKWSPLDWIDELQPIDLVGLNISRFALLANGFQFALVVHSTRGDTEAWVHDEASGSTVLLSELSSPDAQVATGRLGDVFFASDEKLHHWRMGWVDDSLSPLPEAIGVESLAAPLMAMVYDDSRDQLTGIESDGVTIARYELDGDLVGRWPLPAGVMCESSELAQLGPDGQILIGRKTAGEIDVVKVNPFDASDMWLAETWTLPVIHDLRGFDVIPSGLVVNDGGWTRVFKNDGVWSDNLGHYLAGHQADGAIRYPRNRDGGLGEDEHDGTPPRPQCLGDATLDEIVDIADLLVVLEAWNQTGGVADLDWNGVVDIADVLEVVAGFGGCEGSP